MSFSNAYRVQSAGVAYTLDIGFEPTRIEVINYTKWATDATKVLFRYYKGMAAGYALSELCEDTSSNRAIEATNGFTVLDTTSFTANKAVVSGVSKANPGVVSTSTVHGFSAGDKVSFHDIGGMVELNNNRYEIGSVPTTQSFTLKDTDTSGFTTFAAGTAMNEVIDISKKIDASGSYRVTLGTTVMGADNDILYVVAYNDDIRSDLGDVA